MSVRAAHLMVMRLITCDTSPARSLATPSKPANPDLSLSQQQ